MNDKLSAQSHRRRQNGMTLVEVLVTLVLISVGLLGVAALQLTTLRNNQEAYVRTQASILAGYILDRIRANPQGFANDEYSNIDFNGTGAAGTISGADLERWQAEIDRMLPGGAENAAGRLERVPGTNLITVTIRWSEREDRALGEDAGTATFQTRTEI